MRIRASTAAPPVCTSHVCMCGWRAMPHPPRRALLCSSSSHTFGIRFPRASAGTPARVASPNHLHRVCSPPTCAASSLSQRRSYRCTAMSASRSRKNSFIGFEVIAATFSRKIHFACFAVASLVLYFDSYLCWIPYLLNYLFYVLFFQCANQPESLLSRPKHRLKPEDLFEEN